jgi:hypothetical protein
MFVIKLTELFIVLLFPPVVWAQVFEILDQCPGFWYPAPAPSNWGTTNSYEPPWSYTTGT